MSQSEIGKFGCLKETLQIDGITAPTEGPEGIDARGIHKESVNLGVNQFAPLESLSIWSD